MKLFFKIFNEWVLFLTWAFLSAGFLENLISSHSIPGYFKILMVICIISGVICFVVWFIKLMVLIDNVVQGNLK